MSTDLCDATEAGRGSLASFRAAMLEAVECLNDEESSARNSYDVYVEDKLVADFTIFWHAMCAPNKP